MNWCWGQAVKPIAIKVTFPFRAGQCTGSKQIKTATSLTDIFFQFLQQRVQQPLRNSYSLWWLHMVYIYLLAKVNPHCKRPKRSPSLLQYIDSGRTLNKWCLLSAWVKYNLHLVPEDKQLTNLSTSVELKWQHALLPYLVHLSRLERPSHFKHYKGAIPPMNVFTFAAPSCAVSRPMFLTDNISFLRVPQHTSFNFMCSANSGQG